MGKLGLYSLLLIAGLTGSQFLNLLPPGIYRVTDLVLTFFTMTGLAFIMIQVGREFQIDKNNPRQYGWDYVVAATAAAFPWILCTLYFVFVMAPRADWGNRDLWMEALLVGRFASPTSAGVLFSMLAAAGLASTWVFRKARVLAIFDDLDTVLLMIPLKMAMVGLRWELGLIVAIITVQLGCAWHFLRRLRIPSTWPWVLAYGAGLALVSEIIYHSSQEISKVPIHIEVLLPAFVLGCMMAPTEGHKEGAPEVHGNHDPGEERASTVISACFMVLVGLSLPPLELGETMGGAWVFLGLHVLLVTLLSNLGKMFPAFCYRKEAHLRERLAVSVGMFPRGEVGAGVLILSLSYGISGSIVTVGSLSLALNLLLTGFFIAVVRWLIAPLHATGAKG